MRRLADISVAAKVKLVALATSSVAIGQGHSLEVVKELHFPHSLGLLYSAFTYYTGFKVNSGEYKVMGLAPYGEPKYAPIIAPENEQ